jgi:hypothetical protein
MKIQFSKDELLKANEGDLLKAFILQWELNNHDELGRTQKGNVFVMQVTHLDLGTIKNCWAGKGHIGDANWERLEAYYKAECGEDFDLRRQWLEVQRQKIEEELRGKLRGALGTKL